MKLSRVEPDKLYIVQKRVGFYGKVWRSVAVFDNEKDMLKRYPNMEKYTSYYSDRTMSISYKDSVYKRHHGYIYENLRRYKVYDRNRDGYWQKDTEKSA